MAPGVAVEWWRSVAPGGPARAGDEARAKTGVARALGGRRRARDRKAGLYAGEPSEPTHLNAAVLERRNHRRVGYRRDVARLDSGLVGEVAGQLVEALLQHGHVLVGDAADKKNIVARRAPHGDEGQRDEQSRQ